MESTPAERKNAVICDAEHIEQFEGVLQVVDRDRIADFHVFDACGDLFGVLGVVQFDHDEDCTLLLKGLKGGFDDVGDVVQRDAV